jgi:TatD DNase family protein
MKQTTRLSAGCFVGWNFQRKHVMIGTMDTPLYFDAHSHINDPRFDSDITEVLSRMKDASIWSLVVGTEKNLSERAVKLAKENDGLFACVGLHPTDDREEKFDDTFYRTLASEPKTLAIGECGLDYFRLKEEDRKQEEIRQKGVFENQLELAVSLNKPLMIHCRNAHPDMLDILASKKREHGEKLRGNIHFFSEGPEVAKKYFDLDFTISFTGVITFARDYDETVRYAPLDLILSETDCPYVTPAPYRGKRNEPFYVTEVVKKIAEIRGQDFETVRAGLVKNAFRVFQIG